MCGIFILLNGIISIWVGDFGKDVDSEVVII